MRKRSAVARRSRAGLVSAAPRPPGRRCRHGTFTAINGAPRSTVHTQPPSGSKDRQWPTGCPSSRQQGASPQAPLPGEALTVAFQAGAACTPPPRFPTNNYVPKNRKNRKCSLDTVFVGHGGRGVNKNNFGAFAGPLARATWA